MIDTLTRNQRWKFLSRFFGTCSIMVTLPESGGGSFRVEIVE